MAAAAFSRVSILLLTDDAKADNDGLRRVRRRLALVAAGVGRLHGRDAQSPIQILEGKERLWIAKWASFTRHLHFLACLAWKPYTADPPGSWSLRL